jgi:hypothetical protein
VSYAGLTAVGRLTAPRVPTLIQHATHSKSRGRDVFFAVVAPHVPADVLDEVLIRWVRRFQDYWIRSDQAVPQENIDRLPHTNSPILIRCPQTALNLGRPGRPTPISGSAVIGALQCSHQSLHSSGGAVEAFSCSNNLNLDDATLATAHTVDGVDAKPAADKQPGHQKLSHRIHPFSFSGNLPLARTRVLRLSGDSEALLRAVILKPH